MKKKDKKGKGLNQKRNYISSTCNNNSNINYISYDSNKFYIWKQWTNNKNE